MTTIDQAVLYLGKVMEKTHLRSGEPTQRGVVTWANGRGLDPRRLLQETSPDYVIKLTSGLPVINPYPEHWKAVPIEEWTISERVRSALVCFEPPDLEPGQYPADHETWEWHVLMAMFDPATQDRIFEEDWPHLDELAIMVARYFEERIHQARILGAALAR